MTRCPGSALATARADEEFDVSVATRDRRWEYPYLRTSKRGRERRDVVAGRLAKRRVADDAALGMPSRGLELRFDQGEQMHRRCRQRQRRRQHRLQGNETDVNDDDIGPLRQTRALKLSDVGLLHRHQPGMAVQ